MCGSQITQSMDDLQPFEDIYREHRSRVYRFCLTRIRDPTTAEDIANDVFVSAFRVYDQVRPAPDRVPVWLFTIAKNAVTDHWRKQIRWRRLFASMDPPAVAHTDVEQAFEIQTRLRSVLDAMKTLKRRDRTLVALRVGAELSYAEIAQIAGMTEHSATVATLRALERLRLRLGESE
jgi:RNA polymerase sigma-70 factor (ECF subfamily)